MAEKNACTTKKNNNNQTRSRCEQRVSLPSDWPLKSHITQSSSSIMIRLDLLNQSIEFNNLNFRSLCFLKMFTSKKILISTEIRLSRRALRPVGLFFEIHPQSTKILTAFVLCVFTKFLLLRRYWYRKKFDSPGEHSGPWAYFLKSMYKT